MENQNITKFPRYKRYKDSGVDWIGEIPEHWELKKASHYFRAKKGSNAAILTKEYCGSIQGDYPVYSGQTENDGILASINSYEFDYSNSGCILTTTVGAKAMSVSYLQGRFSLSQNCMIIEPKSLAVNMKYYSYLFTTIFSYYRELIPDHMQASFRMEDFYGMRYLLPTSEEQTVIAQFLDHKTAQIDRAIAIKEEQIKLLNERKQIMIQEAVTKGLDPTVPMKDSGVEWIGEIPEHWEVKKIKFLTSKVGSGITPRGGAVTYLSEGIPLLRSQNIFFNKIEFNNVVHISSFTHNEMKNSQVHFGDVLLNITGGSIGRCYFVDVKKEINVNQHVCIIRPIKSEILTKYLHMLFTSKMGQDQIWSCQQGGGREGLNFNAINNFLFPIPQLDTQKKIMAKLENLNHQTEANIELYHNQIQALKEYKTTLINEAVTGKIKVN